MNNHVPSLATCKRLKELGYKQKTEYIWWKYKKLDRSFELCPRGYQIHPRQRPSNLLEWYPAPLASELLEQLPDQVWLPILGGDKEHGLTILKLKNWFIGYSRQGNAAFPEQCRSENLTESAALMWIYLKEKGLI